MGEPNSSLTVIQDASSEVKAEEQVTLAPCVLHVEKERETLQGNDEVFDQMEHVDEAKETDDRSQSSDDEMEGVGENLREQIKVQLLSGEPYFAEWGRTALHRAAEGGFGKVVARLLAVCPFLIDVVAADYDEVQSSALHYAAEAGHVAIVEQLLAVRPGLANLRRSDGDTALHCAAQKGHTAIVERLLALNPALADAKDDEGWTALHLAAKGGHAAIVTRLLAVNPALIDAKTEGGWTTLHCAASARRGDALVAQLLSMNSKPAFVDARTGKGCTALHFAVEHANEAATAQLMAINPALVDAAVLHSAVDRGLEGIVARLLTANPDLVDAADDKGLTPLIRAVQTRRTGIVTQLLTLRPAAVHASYRGCTAFHWAAFWNHKEIFSRLLDAVSPSDLEPLLCRRSTEQVAAVGSGATALHVAAKRSSQITAQLLAVCPALVDVLNDANQTCLHEADRDSVNILLDFKPALAHAVDAEGNTILHTVVRSYSTQLIERVWKINPDALRAVNCHGKTPLQLAVATLGDPAIDLLQWKLTFDEIVSACDNCGKSYVARLGPLMNLQCEELAVVLIPDVVAIVFEYLGL